MRTGMSVDTSIQLAARAHSRSDLTMRAEKLLEQSRMLNARLTHKLAETVHEDKAGSDECGDQYGDQYGDRVSSSSGNQGSLQKWRQEHPAPFAFVCCTVLLVVVAGIAIVLLCVVNVSCRF